MNRYFYKNRLLRVFRLHAHAWYIGYLKQDYGAGSGRASMEGMPTFTTQEAAQEYLDDWAQRKGLTAGNPSGRSRQAVTERPCLRPAASLG